MRLSLLVALVGVVIAQYGGQALINQPILSHPGHVAVIPWHPHYHHHSRSDSWSHSRSDSRERRHKCKNCKKLKKFDSTITSMVAPKIRYIHKKDCLRAVIRCPFDNRNYTFYVGKDKDERKVMATGFFIERTVKCNRKGKWEIEVPLTSDKYRFKYVGCRNNGIKTLTTEAPPTPPSPSACTLCDPPEIMRDDAVPTSIDMTQQPGDCLNVEWSCGIGLPQRRPTSLILGGLELPAETTKATLVCNSAREWAYTDPSAPGTTSPITDISCSTPDCGFCGELQPRSGHGTAPPNFMDGDPVGVCISRVASCSVVNGIQPMLEIRTTDANKVAADPIGATLICNSNALWTYVVDETPQVVTEVACILPACSLCPHHATVVSIINDPIVTVGSSGGCTTVHISCIGGTQTTLVLLQSGQTILQMIRLQTEATTLLCSAASLWTYTDNSVILAACL